ncbi:MAG: hypothetical protein ACODAQ_08835, partial [Phycisphaeraceae bacterium]
MFALPKGASAKPCNCIQTISEGLFRDSPASPGKWTKRMMKNSAYDHSLRDRAAHRQAQPGRWRGAPVCLVVVLGLLIGTSRVAAAEEGIAVSVSGLKVPAQDQIVSLDLDLAELSRFSSLPAEADEGTLAVWELDAQGEPRERAAASLVLPEGESPASTGTLFWRMAGRTEPGETRRFVVREAEAPQAAGDAPSDAGVQVIREDDRLIVRNAFYEIEHDLSQG